MSLIRRSIIMNKYVTQRPPVQIRNNRGFSLLEALLGFLVLSIGLLGIASLQAISLKSGKTAVYSSVAMMKVEELLESMRSNPTPPALLAYAAAGAGPGTDNGCSTGTDCTYPELAQDDIYWWQKNLTAGLPGSVTTSVVYSAPVGTSKIATVTVNVNWSERDKSATGSVSKIYTTTSDICTNLPSEPC